MSKHFWCSRFDETLHNGSTCVAMSCIHCGVEKYFQVICYQRIRGVFFPTCSMLCPEGTSIGAGFIPGLDTIVLSWVWSWGSVLEDSIILRHFYSYFMPPLVPQCLRLWSEFQPLSVSWWLYPSPVTGLTCWRVFSFLPGAVFAEFYHLVAITQPHFEMYSWLPLWSYPAYGIWQFCCSRLTGPYCYPELCHL